MPFNMLSWYALVRLRTYPNVRIPIFRTFLGFCRNDSLKRSGVSGAQDQQLANCFKNLGFVTHRASNSIHRILLITECLKPDDPPDNPKVTFAKLTFKLRIRDLIKLDHRLGANSLRDDGEAPFQKVGEESLDDWCGFAMRRHRMIRVGAKESEVNAD